MDEVALALIGVIATLVTALTFLVKRNNGRTRMLTNDIQHQLHTIIGNLNGIEERVSQTNVRMEGIQRGIEQANQKLDIVGNLAVQTSSKLDELIRR